MCTLERRGRVFVLTLAGDDEHRLGHSLIAEIRAALQQIRAESGPGMALVTCADGKFYSNGLDLRWAQAGGDSSMVRLHQLVSSFEADVMAELISLPMPTIAAVTGHAAAAGFMLSLCHDYIFMRKDRGFLYMSELDIGLPYPESFSALIRSKIASPAAIRNIMLRAQKMNAMEALEMGIVDSACDGPQETLAAAVRLAEELAEKGWNGAVYASIRKQVLVEVCNVLESVDKCQKPVKSSHL